MGQTGLSGPKEGSHLCGQQPILGNNRPAGTQLWYTNIYSEIPPNSPKHLPKINQHVTIPESFQEFIPKKTAGGSSVLHFLSLGLEGKQSVME